MFSLNEFIMKTLKGMIGNYPDFQVMEYALNWYSKGKLTEEDLATIEFLIDAQYAEPYTEEEINGTEPPVVEEPVEKVEEVIEGTETEEPIE